MDQGLLGPPTAAAVPARSAPVPVALRALLAASILLPLLFLLGTALHDWRRLSGEAYADVSRLSAIAKEHALKVVETNALVLDRVEDSVRGLTWAEIEARSAGLQQHLRALDEGIAQITSLHLARPDGTVVVLSSVWPTPPISIAGRDYFKAIAEGGAQGLVFGEPVVARFTGIVTFAMARRRVSGTDAFDGLLIGSVLPGYFQAHWYELGQSRAVSIALLRRDGQPLVVYPRGDSDLIPRPDPAAIPRGIAQASYVPVIERIGERGENLAAFRQVGEYPLVVAVTLSMESVRAEWLSNTLATGAICLLTAAMLAGVTILAIRRWRSEQRTLLRLAATAEELRAEIGRRETAEAGLMRAQRLEALGRLTGGIAHDFNNLLTAILGTVQLLERHLGSGADERARRLLGVARDAVQRGARLNASLLAFARRQTLRAAALDANELVQGFAPLIRGALGGAVDLALRLQPDLPPCRADAAQLEAALLNLAINARDAMPQGGHCTLSTRLVQLGPEELAGNAEARPGAYVAVSLHDTGTGMSPEVRDRAFEPFFTTKPVGSGTGLGLSQVFGFTRQLGGHVALESEPDEGTTVTLFLPVAAAVDAESDLEARQPVAAHTGAPAGAGMSVLLAEDDARVRELLAESLRSAGMQVTEAADGPQALELLRQGVPADVLFSDIVMPGGLSGIELARAARRLRPGLPVLLATGFAGTLAGGDEHGFEVMAKPYDQDVVARRLTDLMAAERARRVA
jgi:signal transduction histidine kinase/CheY-like chemotaxis protein